MTSQPPNSQRASHIKDPTLHRVSLGKTQDDTSGILLAATPSAWGTHSEEHQYKLVGSRLVLATKAFCPFDTAKVKSRKRQNSIQRPITASILRVT